MSIQYRVKKENSGMRIILKFSTIALLLQSFATAAEGLYENVAIDPYKKTTEEVVPSFKQKTIASPNVVPEEPGDSKVFYKDVLAQTQVNFSVTAETTELLGEEIELSSGAISFSQVDVSIPGNSKLPVEIRRSFNDGNFTLKNTAEFADWSIDVPSIHTTALLPNNQHSLSWGVGKECSGPQEPGAAWHKGQEVFAEQYWSGTSIIIGGQDKGLLYYGTPDKTYVTKDHWRSTCYNREDGTGEGFKVTSPDGTVYLFDVPHAVRNNASSQSQSSLAIYHLYLRVSKITDIHGNWVKYSYQQYTTPQLKIAQRLKQISSNDGRVIDVTYTDGPGTEHLIKSVTANGRTWTYDYEYNLFHSLTKVHLPKTPEQNEEKFWQINFASLNMRNIAADYDTYQNEQNTCNTSFKRPATATIKHPNGVTGQFNVERRYHGRTKVPGYQMLKDAATSSDSSCFLAVGLLTKKLTGKGLPTLTWTYKYSENKGGYAEEATAVSAGVTIDGYDDRDLKTTKVTAPDNSVTTSVFYRGWDSLEGQQVAAIYYDTDGTTELKRVTEKFQPKHIATAILLSGNFDVKQYSQQKTESVVKLSNNGESHTYSTKYSDFGPYGLPQLTSEFNSVNSDWKRVSRTTFLHDTALYILNLPTTQEVSTDGVNYTQVNKTDYIAKGGTGQFLPEKVYKFGRLVNTNSYYTDGNLKKSVYNMPNYWVEYSDYYRGQARNIKLPTRYTAQSVTARLTINDTGTVDSVTDLNGYKTSYIYDELDRVKQVVPADTQFAATTISYLDDDTGLGELRQEISRGNYRKNITLNSLMWPLLEKEWDNTKETDTVRYINRSFNSYGKETFSSVVSGNKDESFGTATRYDGLQRVLTQSNTSNGDISYKYFANNSITTTNGKYNQTTVSYRAFGQPEQGVIVKIVEPEAVQTNITVNIYGQPTLITQGNITEKRFYNSYQQLCLKQRPETGIKAYKYNGYGQLEKYAEGLSGNASGCNGYQDSASSWVTNEYDNLGYKKKQTFADGSPTVNYILDAQGNLLTLNNGHSNWQYSYNSQHLLESETLTIDSKTYVIDPEYNNMGHLKALTYGGGSLSYNPDALGNATEVKEGSTSYASNVAYYASGQLKSFNYGNGLHFNQTLNSAYQPEYRQVKQNGVVKFGQHYQYDNNNNIEYIGDLTDNSKSLSMVYDGLDRLTTASGSWGQGSLSYDVLGNIKSKNLGSQQLTYSYNESSNRLESVTGGYSFSYDDRGNVTNNGKRSFSFNRANQLVNSGTYSYLYDGHNRRVKKSGSSLGYSVYSLAGQLLLTDGPQGTTRYIHLGSELIAKTGSAAALDDKRGYTGHLEDKDLTLTYMQQRYYDPVIGRFYSNDPIGFRDTHSFNRYAYANNNPYKFVDPFGMASEDSNMTEREAAKREARCKSDPNCSYFRFDSRQSVSAKWQPGPEDSSGKPANGNISCNKQCQKSAIDAAQFTADEMVLAQMMNGYYRSQSNVADGMLMAGAAVYDPVTTATYFAVNHLTGSSYSRASFIQSLAVSAALKPVVSYLGQDSSAAARIWTHNMWWLGNGLGYVPLTE